MAGVHDWRERLRNATEVITRAPRVVEHWPEFVYHDLRLRARRAGHPKRSEIALRDGTRFPMPPGTPGLYPVFSEVWLHRRYDGRTGFEIAPDATVVDIGAQVGFFTVRAARAATRGRVIAFEPCPPHYASLERTVTLNDLGNVTLHHQAVWSDDDDVTIRYALRNGNPVATSVFDMGGDLTATVPGITLDQVFDREAIDRCDFLKLDCEGAEYEILGAASDETLGRVDRIAMEWHRLAEGHDPDALADRLRSLGFSVDVTAEAGHPTGYLHGRR